jgi:DNA-binding CsgD family transcriptional regulator
LRRDWHLFTENVALQVNGWTPDEARRFGEHLRANVDYRTARHYLAFFGGVDVSDELSLMDIPVLVVHHKALRYMTLDSSADLASMIPGAQLLPLEGLFSESTGALADALIAFFSDSDAQSDTVSYRRRTDGPTSGQLRPPPLVAQPNGTRRAPRPDALSDRELEVLQLIAGGLSNQQIAVSLAISLNTVFRHVSHIYEKTGATNRVEAAAYARTRDPS